jgi:hypothetical protein
MMAAEHIERYSVDCEFETADAPWGGRLVSVLVFLIPAAQVGELQIVGKLFASDILLLLLLPVVLLSKRHILNEKLPRTFLFLGLLWFAGQVGTDLFRSTPFVDYVRGWAMITLTLTHFTVLYVLLYQNSRRTILYMAGLSTGGVLSYFLNPSTFAAGDPWKFGYGFGTTLLIIVIATLAAGRSRDGIAGTAILIAAALNLYEGSRSLAGECLVAFTYLLLTKAIRNQGGESSQVSPFRAMLACAALGISAAGPLSIYAYCAGNGLFGYAAWHKYELQSSGRYGVLVGGRGEFLAGLEAATDSPIVGHGSWAKDWRYAAREEATLIDLGYRASKPSDSWVIPSHSHLIGAWVDAGITGALFWLWVLWLPVRALGRLYTTDEPMAPLIAFLAIVLVWEVFFSPYGAERRFITPYFVVVMMMFLNRSSELLQMANGDDSLY